MKTTLILSVVSILLSGCAEMMQAMAKDPVRIHNVGKSEPKDANVLSIASFDASRRNMMVIIDGPFQGRFCAEPPADVALNVKSKTKASGSGEGGATDSRVKGTLDLEGEYSDTVTILAQRTVLLDIYRTGTYSLCQYYVNGAINDKDVAAQFLDFSQKVLSAYEKTLPAK